MARCSLCPNVATTARILQGANLKVCRDCAESIDEEKRQACSRPPTETELKFERENRQVDEQLEREMRWQGR